MPDTRPGLDAHCTCKTGTSQHMIGCSYPAAALLDAAYDGGNGEAVVSLEDALTLLASPATGDSRPEHAPQCMGFDSASGPCAVTGWGDSRQSEGLDLDALTRAMFEAERPGDWPTWADYLGAFGSAGVPPWRRKAERLAREYARALAAAAPKEEPR